MIELYKKYKEIINYLIFGVLTTVINLGTYFLLSSFLLDVSIALELGLANALSWVVAVIFAYVTNKKYVFDIKETKVGREIISFFGSRFLTLVLDIVIMYLGVNVLSFNDKLCKIFSQVIVVGSNYILSKLFVFKKGK